MFPAPLFTVMTPSATVHFAGADRSCADTHSSRFFPSNRMIASDGGAPHSAPGVTAFGSGCHTSVSSGFAVDCCEYRDAAMKMKIANAKDFRICVRMMLKRIHPNWFATAERQLGVPQP